jgi:hypothetical protein
LLRSTEPVNPCSICPNGTPEGLNDIFPFKGVGIGFTCADMVKDANLFETESEVCGVIGSRCCPTSTLPPVAVMTPAPTPAQLLETTHVCSICPSGAINDYGGDSYTPYVMYGIDSTCKELINSAKNFFSGSDACAYAEVDQLECCFTAPVNPCSICPNGATEGLDDILPFKGFGIGWTCADMVKDANLYETEYEVCGVIGSHCCPTLLVVTTAPTPCVATPAPTPTVSGGNKGTVIAVAISAVVVISFMALAVYYFCKMASNIKGPPMTFPERVEHMPEGVIAKAVWETKMHHETAKAPFQVNPAPPPYAPHASTPPLE